MQLSEILVNSRAALASAEYNYAQGLKGNAAQDLTTLGYLIHDELPGLADENKQGPEQPGADKAIADEQEAEQKAAENPLHDEQAKQGTQ